MQVRCPKCGRATPWEPVDRLIPLHRGPEPTEELTPAAIALWCVACSKGHWETRRARGQWVRVWVWTKRTFFVVVLPSSG